MGTETKTEGKKTMTTNAEQNQKAVIEIRHVSKYFGKRKVVNDLSMTTYAGGIRISWTERRGKDDNDQNAGRADRD